MYLEVGWGKGIFGFIASYVVNDFKRFVAYIHKNQRNVYFMAVNVLLFYDESPKNRRF